MAMYLKYGEIKGCSTEKSHKGWIDIESISFGVSRAITAAPGTSQNREGSTPRFSELTITRRLDDASPGFFIESTTGTGKPAVIEFTKSGDGQDIYLKYELEDCLVSGYSISAHGDIPVESIQISFTKFMMSFTPHDDKNKAQAQIRAGFDMAQGIKL